MARAAWAGVINASFFAISTRRHFDFLQGLLPNQFIYNIFFNVKIYHAAINYWTKAIWNLLLQSIGDSSFAVG